VFLLYASAGVDAGISTPAVEGAGGLMSGVKKPTGEVGFFIFRAGVGHSDRMRQHPSNVVDFIVERPQCQKRRNRKSVMSRPELVKI
jgi:hypothetical protein